MTSRLAAAFDSLMESAPPASLLSGLHQVFYHYAMQQHPATKNFPEVAAHLYELVRFLELAQIECAGTATTAGE